MLLRCCLILLDTIKELFFLPELFHKHLREPLCRSAAVFRLDHPSLTPQPSCNEPKPRPHTKARAVIGCHYSAVCWWERWLFVRDPVLLLQECWGRASCSRCPGGRTSRSSSPNTLSYPEESKTGRKRAFCRLSGLVEMSCSPDKPARLVGEHMQCFPAWLLVEKTSSSLGTILQPYSNRHHPGSLVFSLNVPGVLGLATTTALHSPRLEEEPSRLPSLLHKARVRKRDEVRKRDAMGGSEH